MNPQKTSAVVFSITLSLILIVNGQNVAAQNTQTVKKELPAVKTEQPPTIDGVLDDACWQDAPKAVGFTDQRTERPAKNQSIGRLIYTDKAIYTSAFTSTMICPTKLWRVKSKIRRESAGKTGCRSVSTHSTHTSFPTGIFSS